MIDVKEGEFHSLENQSTHDNMTIPFMVLFEFMSNPTSFSNHYLAIEHFWRLNLITQYISVIPLVLITILYLSVCPMVDIIKFDLSRTFKGKLKFCVALNCVKEFLAGNKVNHMVQDK